MADLLDTILVSVVVLLSILAFIYGGGRFRPLAWLNLFISLILLPGGLFYDKFYHSLPGGVGLVYYLVGLSAFLSLWVFMTPQVNHLFRSALVTRVNIDNTMVFIWRVLIGILAVSVIAVIVQRGGITQTGLWGLLFDADHYNELRELTHKGMSNPLVKTLYGYSLMFLPFMSVCALVLSRNRNYRNEAYLGLVLIVLVALLAGARAYVVTILLSILVYMIIRAKHIPVKKIAIILLLGFSVVVMMTALRSDRTEGYEDFSNKAYQVSRRIVAAPFYTGVVHMEYVRQHGYWDFIDVTGFPGKGVLGFDHTNNFRIVGEWESGIESSNMNTSEVFLEMSIFGVMLGTIVACLILLLVDISMLMLVFVNGPVRTPLFASIIVYLTNVVSTGVIELAIRSIMLIAIIYLLGVIRQGLIYLSSSGELRQG